MIIIGIGELLVCTLSFVVSLLAFEGDTFFAPELHSINRSVPLIFLFVVWWVGPLRIYGSYDRRHTQRLCQVISTSFPHLLVSVEVVSLRGV